MGYGFGNAVVLKGFHTKHVKSDECSKPTHDPFRLQTSSFFFIHFLTLLIRAEQLLCCTEIQYVRFQTYVSRILI